MLLLLVLALLWFLCNEILFLFRAARLCHFLAILISFTGVIILLWVSEDLEEKKRRFSNSWWLLKWDFWVEKEMAMHSLYRPTPQRHCFTCMFSRVGNWWAITMCSMEEMGDWVAWTCLIQMDNKPSFVPSRLKAWGVSSGWIIKAWIHESHKKQEIQTKLLEYISYALKSIYPC
jgi:hypothetical protein